MVLLWEEEISSLEGRIERRRPKLHEFSGKSHGKFRYLESERQPDYAATRRTGRDRVKIRDETPAMVKSRIGESAPARNLSV